MVSIIILLPSSDTSSFIGHAFPIMNFIYHQLRCYVDQAHVRWLLDMDGHCMERAGLAVPRYQNRQSGHLSPVHFTIAIHAESGNLINFVASMRI